MVTVSFMVAMLSAFLSVGCVSARPDMQDIGDNTAIAGGEITVSGKATVRVPADMATIRLGVVSISEDPEEARAQNADVSKTSMNAVRELGIPERHIQVNTLRLEPNRIYDQDQRRYVEKGFQAIRRVSIRLENLDLLPQLIADVVHVGANRIEGISYGLVDDRGTELDALDSALLNAREKARRMAATMGVSVGTILTVSEQGVNAPMPNVQFERALTAKSFDTGQANPDAYASGEIEVTAHVVVVFKLEGEKN